MSGERGGVRTLSVIIIMISHNQGGIRYGVKKTVRVFGAFPPS